MDFIKFTEYIKEELENTYAKSSVQTMNVIKNNNIKLTGISVHESDTNVGPTIYLNKFYESYKKDGNLNSIVKEIKEIYESNRVKNYFDTSIFLDFQKAKTRIVCKLINYEKNQELLNDVPYIQILDLAIVFQYLFENVKDGTSTILIRNEHLSYWKVFKGELYKIALENTSKLLKPCIETMHDIIKELIGSNSNFADVPMIPLYVLTNKYRINGAICMICKNTLKNFADSLHSDIYILPSSIHEVILLPVDREASGEELSEMVRYVNENEVDAEEILSNHVYYFSRNTNQLEIKY